MKIKNILAATMVMAFIFMCVPVLNVNAGLYDDIIVAVRMNSDPVEFEKKGTYAVDYENGTTKSDLTSVILLLVNGEFVSDADAVIQNGTTLVPLRVVSNKLGANVNWNNDTRTAEIKSGDTVITVGIGNSYITVNGSVIETTSPASIINSLTYIPLRAVASAFGADVGYYEMKNSQIVWVQNKIEAVTVTSEEAENIAINVFCDGFLEELKEFFEGNKEAKAILSTITTENIRGFDFMGYKFTFDCEADLGEYYYIQFCEGDVGFGALIDKYDGKCYAVSHYYVPGYSVYKEGHLSGWIYRFE
ncbi:MAG: copper amine oxidase N-terminal domain-containing protein [Clostridiales bacterium]|nr:copper amine oxidase N-terminal domain-containing protein [Clostridiales bacterium]